MLHTDLSYHGFKALVRKADQVCGSDVLIIGDFLPSTSRLAWDCSILAERLILQGANVVTASLTQTATAQYKLCFHTPLKGERSSKRFSKNNLKKFSQTIVFNDHFWTSPFLSITNWRQAKETRRRALFLRHVIRHAPNVDLRSFGSGPSNLLNRMVRLASKVSSSQPQIFSQSRIAACDVERRQAVQKVLTDHANFGMGTNQLTSARLRRQISEDKDKFLQKILNLAETPVLRTCSATRRLQMKDKATDPILRTCPPHPIVAAADATYGLHNLTSFMLHLRSVLNLKHHFPLQDKCSVEAFEKWYLKQAHLHVPSGWVPLPEPMPTRKPDFLSLRDEAVAVARFLDHQCAFGDLPRSVQTLLKHRKSDSGPDGLALLVAILSGSAPAIQDASRLWFDQDLANWAKCELTSLPPTKETQGPNGSGIRPALPATIIGWTQEKTGLAENCAMSLTAFRRLNIKTRVKDAKDLSPQTLSSQPQDRLLKKSFVLHHVNADRIPLNTVSPAYFRRNDVVHVGFCLWETTQIPKEHLLAFDMLDAIWSPSRFVTKTYQQAGFANITTVGKGLRNLEGLAKIGRDQPPSPDQFTALIAYDFHSSVERKNPLAAVHAFQTAFPSRQFPNCKLVVKSTPRTANHWGDPLDQTGAIEKIARKDRRISLIDAFLPEAAFHKMIANSHIILSTHRGEGFGYLPALALAMNRPVICTDFGGVQDFCTLTTAFPVQTDLVDVPKGHAIFDAKGAQWANPSPDAFSTALQQAYQNYEAAKSLSCAGQGFMQSQYSIDALANRYKSALENLNLL